MRAWGYLAALVVLVIGYQVTDVFRFASNWVFLGTIIGLWTMLKPEPSDAERCAAVEKMNGTVLGSGAALGGAVRNRPMRSA